MRAFQSAMAFASRLWAAGPWARVRGERSTGGTFRKRKLRAPVE